MPACIGCHKELGLFCTSKSLVVGQIGQGMLPPLPVFDSRRVLAPHPLHAQLGIAGFRWYLA